MARIIYPLITGNRGVGYWLNIKNLVASRQKYFRVDYSNEWRYEFGSADPPDRSVELKKLLDRSPNSKTGFKFIVLGDTGEGDESQYGLLPLIREFNPDFIIINGDVAYPAGRMGTGSDEDDFMAGFFQVYQHLDIPIWATPGNHEYYSSNNGRDFYDIFCSRKYDKYWSQFGLKHSILQPGMYWEISDVYGDSKLEIIGIDSGKSANLDGHNDWWQFWKRKIYPDHTQHKWLDERLRKAEEKNAKVIVLFHIPALAKEQRIEEHLSTLHQIISDYNCVKLVLCGHDHNHQQYSSDIFHRYLVNEESKRNITNSSATLMVNGGGGAFLQTTNYNDGEYGSIRYPNREEWIEYAGWGRNVVSRLGKDKSIISKVTNFISKDVLSDANEPRYLSFIFIEFNPEWQTDKINGIRVTPIFMDDLNSLYSCDDTVHVMDKNHHIDSAKVNACRQDSTSLRGNLEIMI